MGKIVISENVSLDGVVQDPDRRGGLQARRLVRPSSDGKDLEAWAEVELDEALRRRGPAARPAQRRVVRARGGHPGAASGRTG